MEAKVYKELQGGPGIPKLYGYRNEGKYNVLVMELLGKSLEGLFKVCHRKLSIPTSFVLADQMVSLIIKDS